MLYVYRNEKEIGNGRNPFNELIEEEGEWK